MRLHTGTSGFAYKEWKGTFYPQELPAADMLRFYSRHFSTVEINNTFYRLPAESTLLQWAEQVPPNFTFVLKASQRITHQKRLKDAAEPLDYFVRTATVLGNALGPLLFQLPPNLKKDAPRLHDFLALLPPRMRCAFEFRHSSWLDDEVFNERAQCRALCCRHG
jgi:uncharacterized protein YecE (DUF72 family)